MTSTLSIVIESGGLTEAEDSLSSLQRVVSSGYLADGSIERVQRLFDLATVDIRHLATFRADKLTLLLELTEEYLACVAAIAAKDAERHVICIEQRHGWPILSVVSLKTTVAEGVVAANATPEAAR